MATATGASTGAPIPLTNITGPLQSSANSASTATPATNTNVQGNTQLTTNASNPSQSTRSRPTANSSPTTGHLGRLKNSLSFANGIGTAALVAAFIFGVGAWVGMKVQISQGTQNMELSIWTACADHEAIQNTSLCKSIMAKDFSQFGTRDVPLEEPTADTDKKPTGLVKRDMDTNTDESDPEPGTRSLSPLDKLLAKVSAEDQAFINPDTTYQDIRYLPEPALRAVAFPFVNLLVKPLTWVFEFVEYMLLLVIYCIHKVFSWLTSIVLFILQAYLYSIVESVCKSVLAVFDAAVLEVMPSWVPFYLASDVVSLLSITALRSYWYATSYWGSLKWIAAIRVGLWLLILGISGLSNLPATIQSGRDNVRTLMHQDRTIPGPSSVNIKKWLSRTNSFPNMPSFVNRAAGAPPSSDQPFSASGSRTSSDSAQHADGEPRNRGASLRTPALPPPPRRSPSPSMSEFEAEVTRRPRSPVISSQEGESAEEMFYKDLSLKNRRPHIGARS